MHVNRGDERRTLKLRGRWLVHDVTYCGVYFLAQARFTSSLFLLRNRSYQNPLILDILLNLGNFMLIY